MTAWLFAMALAWGQAPEPPTLPLDDELAVPAVSAPDDAPELPPELVEEEPEAVTFESPPALGSETLVVVKDPFGRPERGATVQVIHRPGLHTERTEAIGITDSRGRVRWVPSDGGIARVRAGDQERMVSVEWGSAQPDTATVLVLLGLAGLLMTGYGLVPRRRRKKTA